MSSKLLGSFVVALTFGWVLVVAAPSPANAKPEFAAATGKPCGACHANPSGGGQLTAAGEKYKKTLK
jgi:hypothetical protein